MLTSFRDSPRWLISKDRNEDALKSLKKLRRKEDVDNGLIDFEIAAFREEGQNTVKKGNWRALFDRGNRRRTG